MDEINRYVVDLLAGVDTATPQLDKYAAKTGQMNKALIGFGKQGKKIADAASNSWLSYYATALKGIALWGLAAGSIYGTLRAIKDNIQLYKDLEYAMAEIKVVTNETASAYANLKDELFDLAITYGGKVTEIANATKIWTQQGKSLTESLGLMKTTLMGVNVTGLSVGGVTEDLTAAMKAFNIDSDNSITILDKWIKVASTAAVTMQTLANATKRSAEAAGIAGFTIDELNGAIVALVEATRMSGEQAGTSLKTIVTRLFREQSREVLKTMAAIQIYTDTSETNYRKLGGILDELALKWKEMNRAEQINFVIKAVGIRKGNEFATMLNHYGRAVEATIHSLISQGMTLKSNAIIMDTGRKKSEQLTAATQKLWNTILEGSGIIETLYSLAVGFRKILEIVNKVSVAFGGYNKVVSDAAYQTRLLAEAALVIGGIFTGQVWVAIAGATALFLEFVMAIGRYINTTENASRKTKELADTQLKLKQSEVGTVETVKGLIAKYNSLAQAMEANGKVDKEYILRMEQIKKGVKDITALSPELFKGIDFSPLEKGYDVIDGLEKRLVTMLNNLKKAAIDIQIEMAGLDLIPLEAKEEKYKDIERYIEKKKKDLNKLFLPDDPRQEYTTETEEKRVILTESIARANKQLGIILTEQEIIALALLRNTVEQLKVKKALIGLEPEGLGVLHETEDVTKNILNTTKEIVDEWINLEKEISNVTVRGIEAVLDGTSTWTEMLTNIGNVIRHEIIQGLVEAANISGMIRGMVEKTGLFGGAGAYALAGVPQYGAKTQQPSTFEQASGAMGAAMPVAKAGIMGTISSILPYVGIGMALGEAFGLFGKKDEAPMIISNANITVDEVNMYAKKVVPIGWYTGATITPRSIVHTDINLKVEGTDKLVKVTADRANKSIRVREERY